MKSFKLDLKEEKDKTRLARGKSGGDMLMFEGWCASIHSMLNTLEHI